MLEVRRASWISRPVLLLASSKADILIVCAGLSAEFEGGSPPEGTEVVGGSLQPEAAKTAEPKKSPTLSQMMADSLILANLDLESASGSLPAAFGFTEREPQGEERPEHQVPEGSGQGGGGEDEKGNEDPVLPDTVFSTEWASFGDAETPRSFADDGSSCMTSPSSQAHTSPMPKAAHSESAAVPYTMSAHQAVSDLDFFAAPAAASAEAVGVPRSTSKDASGEEGDRSLSADPLLWQNTHQEPSGSAGAGGATAKDFDDPFASISSGDPFQNSLVADPFSTAPSAGVSHDQRRNVDILTKIF